MCLWTEKQDKEATKKKDEESKKKFKKHGGKEDRDKRGKTEKEQVQPEQKQEGLEYTNAIKEQQGKKKKKDRLTKEKVRSN